MRGRSLDVDPHARSRATVYHVLLPLDASARPSRTSARRPATNWSKVWRLQKPRGPNAPKHAALLMNISQAYLLCADHARLALRIQVSSFIFRILSCHRVMALATRRPRGRALTP